MKNNHRGDYGFQFAKSIYGYREDRNNFSMMELFALILLVAAVALVISMIVLKNYESVLHLFLYCIFIICISMLYIKGRKQERHIFLLNKTVLDIMSARMGSKMKNDIRGWW